MRTQVALFSLICFFAVRAFSQNPAAPVNAAAPVAKEPASIEGRVLNVLTGEPIRRANLSLFAMPSGATAGGPTQSVAAVSDAEGKFKFENLEPRRYSLSADKTGFVRQQYGSSSGQFGPGTPLTVSSGQTMKNLEFKLTPQAVISGRVLDDEGEPVAHVSIQVMRRTAYSKRSMGVMGMGTNDVGEFRIANLTPGKYILRADYRGGMYGPTVAPPASADGQGAEDYVTTYYPGTTDADAAIPIAVSPGQEVSRLEFRLQKARVYRVRGKIVGTPVDAGSRVQVSLAPQRRPGGGMIGMIGFGGSGNVKPDGSFEIPSVQPGAYILSAMRIEAGAGRPQNIGRLPVTVSNGNVDSITIMAGVALTMTGNVQMDGDDQTRISGSVYLESSEGIGFGVQPGRIQQDGTFKMEGVSRDKYFVAVMGLPEGSYVKRVRAGSIDVLENGLDLSQAELAPPLQIVISPKSATIEGVVRNDDKPWPGAAVTLLPEPMQLERLRMLQKMSPSDQSGRFSLKGIAPGEYRLYAWQEFFQISELEADQLKTYESNSVKIKVAEGAREQVELKLIRPQQP